MVRTPCILCVLVAVFVLVLSDQPWWATGSVFRRVITTTTTPAPVKIFLTASGRQQTCQCSKPHFCRNFITLKSSAGPMPSCPSGEVCCQGLRQATAFEEDEANGVVPTNSDEGISHEDDFSASEKDITDEYEDDPETEVYASMPVHSPVPPKPTPNQRPSTDGDVVDLGSITGSAEAKPVEFQCGVATPHLFVDDKTAASGPVASTRLGQYPWTLVLLYSEGGTVIASCGAILIKLAFAITAAHCVAEKDISRLTVRAGEWDLNSEDETHSHMDRKIKQVYIHPEYQKFGFHHDIAFIELDKPFVESPNVGILCLPEEKKMVNTSCIATGWGMQGNVVSPGLQSKMKAVHVKIEHPANCVKILRKTDLGSDFNMSKSAFCATATQSNQDTGIGDGGGPLFCKHPGSDNYIAVGIVSWGKLKFPGSPGVYTSIPTHKKWILDKIAEILNL